jgi:predicted alpha-1,6-mannanase (GH76 family)
VSADARERWALTRLLRHVSARTGRWSTPTGESWQPALAIEALLTGYERTGEPGYRSVVAASFARYRGRRSRFYDDDGWYLNAWLRAYAATGAGEFLDEAVALFAELTRGWDDTCGGGVWWRTDNTYKNAITTELFLLAAARLHELAPDRAPYLDWAHRAWAWLDGSGLINADDLVNDGLDSSCTNNGQPTWTYNQGVLLSGLVQLWRCTGEASLLRRAERIADAAMATLVYPDGVLREPSEPDLGNKDAQLFKGIFGQGLARLYAAERADAAYLRFLAANADAAWQSARTDRGVGLLWHGPPGRVTMATHTSACLLFGEVARLMPAADHPPR